MRILIVLREFYSPSKPIGGAERQALKLASCFVANDVTVRIVCGKWDWGQPSDDSIDTIPVDRHFTAWGLFNIKGIRRFGLYIYLLSLLFYLIWHRNEYDIIHCHSALFGAYIVTFAGKLLNKKTVIRSMASGTWGDVQRVQTGSTIWGARWMQNRSINADYFVALNPQVVEELSNIGVPGTRIIQIPNGVSVPKVNPKSSYAIGKSVNLLFVGRLHPQKGVDILLLALESATSMAPEISWRLNVAGGGYLQDQLKSMCNRLDLNQMVNFLGEVDDITSLYQAADIFVMPSRSEGMSNALLEAMANGLPPVVSDIPGNVDLVTDGETGLLFEMENAAELAENLVKLAQNLGLRERIGRSAYRRVVEKYSITTIANKYINLYSNLIGTEANSSSNG